MLNLLFILSVFSQAQEQRSKDKKDQDGTDSTQGDGNKQEHQVPEKRGRTFRSAAKFAAKLSPKTQRRKQNKSAALMKVSF